MKAVFRPRTRLSVSRQLPPAPQPRISGTYVGPFSFPSLAIRFDLLLASHLLTCLRCSQFRYECSYFENISKPGGFERNPNLLPENTAGRVMATIRCRAQRTGLSVEAALEVDVRLYEELRTVGRWNAGNAVVRGEPYACLEELKRRILPDDSVALLLILACQIARIKKLVARF